MSPLLSIRSQRDQMSAIERRIADFILSNAHLLRDYSSQQLASALKISQSSVVKFTQKLGFKGYPDLKYSVSEALGRDAGGATTGAAAPPASDPKDDLAQDLLRCKAHAEEETRLINPRRSLESIVTALDRAGKVFLLGTGEDGIAAQGFAARLANLGILVLFQPDLHLMRMLLASSQANDVLMVFSQHGNDPQFIHCCTQLRERRGKVVSVTRNTTNSLRVHAHYSLVISAHDERAPMKALLFNDARQQLLDLTYLLLCEGGRRTIDLTGESDDF